MIRGGRSEQNPSFTVWTSDEVENQTEGFTVRVEVTKLGEIVPPLAVMAPGDGAVLVEDGCFEEPLATGDDYVVEVGVLMGPFGVELVEMELNVGAFGVVGFQKERRPEDGESEVMRRESPCVRSVLLVVVDLLYLLYLREDAEEGLDVVTRD